MNDRVLMTTLEGFHGYSITETLDVVYYEAEGRIGSIAQERTVQGLKKKARDLGANAVIGLLIETRRHFLKNVCTAYGVAVRIVEERTREPITDTKINEEITAVMVARIRFPEERPILRRRTLFVRHCGRSMQRIAFKRYTRKHHADGPPVDSILVCVAPDCAIYREPRIGY